MKHSHTGLEMHDGYAPHSHEIRADHNGVPGISDDARRLPPQTAAPGYYHRDGTLCIAGHSADSMLCAENGGPVTAGAPAGHAHLPPTAEDHAATASWILQEIDIRMRDEKAPRSLLELAAIALAHAVTSLAAGNFRAEGGSGEFTAEGGSAQEAREAILRKFAPPAPSIRNRRAGAPWKPGKFRDEGGPGESAAEGGSAPERGRRPRRPRDRVLAVMRAGADGITTGDLAAVLRMHPEVISVVLKALYEDGLVTNHSAPGRWFLSPEPPAPDAGLRERILSALRHFGPGMIAESLAVHMQTPAPVITGELEQMAKAGLVTTGYGTESGRWFLSAAGKFPAQFARLREQIVFWLAHGFGGPDGETLRWLAQQAGYQESEVLAELARMKNEGLVRSTERGRKITWSLVR